ncbi:MAG: hypothetical protein F6K23_23200 [Okeania sp. SIO2C9]|nr:hypothetical protein [Okeania sp. SIO2C9]
MGTHPRTPPVEGNVGRWGVWEKLKNIYPHHYHAGLPNKENQWLLQFLGVSCDKYYLLFSLNL